MNKNEYISISEYSVKLPKAERDLNKGNSLHSQTPLDYRILDELKAGTLPKPLHDYFLDELWLSHERLMGMQISKASKPRRCPVLTKVITTLAQQSKTTKGLWSELYNYLDSADGDPKETGGKDADLKKSSIEYTDEKGLTRRISFGHFQNELRRVRKEKS